MKLSQKTIQSYIDYHIKNECLWSNVIYRGSDWELTCEEYPEDNTANFYFTNGKTYFAIQTDSVFIDEVLKSATVKAIYEDIE